ncbi:MAG: CBS domain-containing protein [Chitinophagales bacterium]
MFAKDYIDTSLPFLRTTDTVEYALDLMQEYKQETLAVVHNNHCIGLLTEHFLLEFDGLMKIENLKEHCIQQQVAETAHIFDVLKLATANTLVCVPVINAEQEYVGIITAQKIMQHFAQDAALENNGGVLVLEMESRDYSLTEISRIVESNNAAILHSMISSIPNQQKLYVSLKINKDDLKDIQLSFERYQYNVIAVIHQSEYEIQLKERYDSLMRYLEV